LEKEEALEVVALAAREGALAVILLFQCLAVVVVVVALDGKGL